MPSFVFIELTDRDLNWLFAGISRILEPDRPWRATHLTIRGPYSNEIPEGVISSCRAQLKHDVLTIGGVGHFSNPGEHVVYLSVNSPNLKRVWWKPDFPIEEFGFNPHISLYRGKDAGLAREVFRFFEHEKIELNCYEFRVVGYVSKQLDLVPDRLPIRHYPFHERISGSVKENLLDRLDVVVTRHRRRSPSSNPAARQDG